MAQSNSASAVPLSVLLPALDLGEFASAPVNDLCLDSRKLESGDCFVAFPGEQVDGRKFIDTAVAKGAALVLSHTAAKSAAVSLESDVVHVAVPNLRDTLSLIAGRFYDQPSAKMQLVGITGTNGKTTCSQWLSQVLSGLSRKSASIGTLGYGVVGSPLHYTGMTTPDAIEFQKILSGFVDQDVTVTVAEVSSHSLVLGRVNALEFDVAVMTNISRDHLDFHGDLASYVAAKCELVRFETLRRVILNKDDAFFADFENASIAPVLSVSLQDTSADFYCESVVYSGEGMSTRLATPEGSFDINLSLWGEFNLYNVLSVVAAAYACGHPLVDIIPTLAELDSVAGRLERVDMSADVAVMVDFAHTPDALKSVLEALRKHTAQNVWCVFGCGGDRDRGKRPQMAAVAEQLADHIVITSDNPRSENPDGIVEDVIAGLSAPSVATVLCNRAEAIDFAISQAAVGDLVLLAGKGHEDYQLIGTEKIPFSDVAQAQQALQKRGGNQHD